MTADALKAALIGAGVPQAAADQMGSQIDDTMKDCILKLYRSAVNVGKEWDYRSCKDYQLLASQRQYKSTFVNQYHRLVGQDYQ